MRLRAPAPHQCSGLHHRRWCRLMGGAALLTHSQTRASSLQVATGGPGFYSSKGMCAAWGDTHAAGLRVVRIRSARVALEVASRQGLRGYPPQRAPGSAPPARGDNQRLARSLGPAKTRMASAASMLAEWRTWCLASLMAAGSALAGRATGPSGGCAVIVSRSATWVAELSGLEGGACCWAPFHLVERRLGCDRPPLQSVGEHNPELKCQAGCH